VLGELALVAMGHTGRREARADVYTLRHSASGVDVKCWGAAAHWWTRHGFKLVCEHCSLPHDEAYRPEEPDTGEEIVLATQYIRALLCRLDEHLTDDGKLEMTPDVLRVYLRDAFIAGCRWQR
jgi:hypothetical protein